MTATNVPPLGPGRDAAQSPPAPATPRSGVAVFAAALARARISSEVREAEAVSPGAPPQLRWSAVALLAERRSDAGEAQAHLRARRAVASELADSTARYDAIPLAVPTAVAPREDTPVAPLFPASAIDRVAIAVRMEREHASLELEFGPEVRVRIARVAGGIDLLLQTGSGSRSAADAELPRLVAGLRARGVTVAKARLQASVRAMVGALTPELGSARTAGAQNPGGTVAKW